MVRSGPAACASRIPPAPGSGSRSAPHAGQCQGACRGHCWAAAEAEPHATPDPSGLSDSGAARRLPGGHGVPWSTSSPSGHMMPPEHLNTRILKRALKDGRRRWHPIRTSKSKVIIIYAKLMQPEGFNLPIVRHHHLWHQIQHKGHDDRYS